MGVPAVLAAFQAANTHYPGRLELQVISTFADDPVDLPPLPNLRHRLEATRDEVASAMQHGWPLRLGENPHDTCSFRGWFFGGVTAAIIDGGHLQASTALRDKRSQVPNQRNLPIFACPELASPLMSAVPARRGPVPAAPCST